MPNKTFSELVTYYREKRKLSLGDLAKKCRVSKTAIYNIEHGAEPKLSLALHLQTSLGIPQEAIFNSRYDKSDIEKVITIIDYNFEENKNIQTVFSDENCRVSKIDSDSKLTKPWQTTFFEIYVFVEEGELTVKFEEKSVVLTKNKILNYPSYLLGTFVVSQKCKATVFEYN